MAVTGIDFGVSVDVWIKSKVVLNVCSESVFAIDVVVESFSNFDTIEESSLALVDIEMFGIAIDDNETDVDLNTKMDSDMAVEAVVGTVIVVNICKESRVDIKDVIAFANAVYTDAVINFGCDWSVAFAWVMGVVTDSDVAVDDNVDSKIRAGIIVDLDLAIVVSNKSDKLFEIIADSCSSKVLCVRNMGFSVMWRFVLRNTFWLLYDVA